MQRPKQRDKDFIFVDKCFSRHVSADTMTGLYRWSAVCHKRQRPTIPLFCLKDEICLSTAMKTKKTQEMLVKSFWWVPATPQLEGFRQNRALEMNWTRRGPAKLLFSQRRHSHRCSRPLCSHPTTPVPAPMVGLRLSFAGKIKGVWLVDWGGCSHKTLQRVYLAKYSGHANHVL